MALWVTFGWKAEATWPPWELLSDRNKSHEAERRLSQPTIEATLYGDSNWPRLSGWKRWWINRILQGAFILFSANVLFHIEISVSNPRGSALFCFSDFFVVLNMCMSTSSYRWAFSTLSHSLLLPLCSTFRLMLSWYPSNRTFAV